MSLGQVSLPFGLSLPDFSPNAPALQPWTAPAMPNVVDTSGLTIGGGGSSYTADLQALNFLPIGETGLDTSVINAPISSYVAAGEPLAPGADGSAPSGGNVSTWIWLALILLGGMMVARL
jgi:hypothetical protein